METINDNLIRIHPFECYLLGIKRDQTRFLLRQSDDQLAGLFEDFIYKYKESYLIYLSHDQYLYLGTNSINYQIYRNFLNAELSHNLDNLRGFIIYERNKDKTAPRRS